MASGEDFDLETDIRTRAAWLYYMEGMTQDAVAGVLGLTRARVLRMLASCREDGTVQISVTSPLTRCVALERQLERGSAAGPAPPPPPPPRGGAPGARCPPPRPGPTCRASWPTA